MSLLTKRFRRQAHSIGTNRLGYVLDAVAAERAVIEGKLIPDLVVDGLGDADGAGLGKRLEPGRDVDAIAKDIVAVDDHIAEIYPDPQLQAAIRRNRVIDRARCPLHLDRAT